MGLTAAVAEACRAVGLTLAPPVCLGLLIVWLRGLIHRALPRWAGVALGIVGTPVHETSHLLACWLFGHRVTRFRPFDPRPDGSLGSVEHAFPKGSLWRDHIGNTVIAFAPVAGGAAALWLLSRLFSPYAFTGFEPPPPVLSLPVDMAGWRSLAVSVFDYYLTLTAGFLAPPSLTAWQFHLYLFCALSISIHLPPSRADLSGTLLPLLLIGVAVTLLLAGLAHFGGIRLPAAALQMGGLWLSARLALAVWFLAAVALLTGLTLLARRLIRSI